MLKQVDKEKNPGLAKLPEKVRNRMGYAKKGKMLKAKKGKDIKLIESIVKKPILGTGQFTRMKGAAKSAKKKRIGGMSYANVGMAAKKVREKEMMKASEGKSVRGYGAARTSGMGLQDESLPPGKSLDYYKDLM